MEGAKKSKTSIYIIVIAILLIAAGVVLIMTGNNKSFIEKKDTKKPSEEEKQEEEQNKEEEIPDRGLDPYYVDEDIILDLIVEKKNSEFTEENWGVQNVTLIAHDEEGAKILVSYEEVHEDASTILKQTIVSILNGEKSVELPGWIEGERDLTVYNFIPYEEIGIDLDMQIVDGGLIDEEIE